MIDKVIFAIGGGTIVASVGVLAFFDYRKKRVSEIAKNLSVDIPEFVLQQAVEYAAEREAEKQIREINTRTLQLYEGTVKHVVQKELEKQKTTVKSDVKEELERKVKHIDIDDIRQEIIDEVSAKATKKLERDMDDILDKHNDELDKINRIYSSIADKLEGN